MELRRKRRRTEPLTMEKRLTMSSWCRLRVRNARQHRLLYHLNISPSCEEGEREEEEEEEDDKAEKRRCEEGGV